MTRLVLTATHPYGTFGRKEVLRHVGRFDA